MPLRGLESFAEQHRRFLVCALLVLTAAFGLRWALRASDCAIGWDASDYDDIAENLLAGNGFVYDGVANLRGEDVAFRLRGHRPPIYPLFLAAVYKLTDHSVRAVYTVQALIHCITAYAVYLLALMLFRKQAPAFLSLSLFSIHFPLQIFVTLVGTEILFALFLVLHVLFLARWIKKPEYRAVAMSGLFLGLATLTRPTTFLLPLFILPLFVTVRSSGLRRSLAAYVVLLVASTAVISPWMVRQYSTFGKFVPVTTGGGITLWEGAGPAAGQTAKSWVEPGVPDQTVEAFLHMFRVSGDAYSAESEMDSFARKEALRIVRGDPANYVRLALVKAPKFWLGVDLESASPFRAARRDILGLVMNSVLLVSAVLGAVVLWKRKAVAFLAPACALLYMGFLHIFPYCLHRYGLPLYPLVIVFSAAGIVWAIQRVGGGGSDGGIVATGQDVM
ncbi:MAG: glycosyltransferase family 39 protein [Candidatus Eisenbacteria sp.]|nr:glycosyltransferase family 39 protein [Candidatus Eisenbacteria bacterium]